MIGKQVYVICDGEGCPAVTGAETFATEQAQARRQARQLGWSVAVPGALRFDPRRDYCPKCAAKETHDAQ